MKLTKRLLFITCTLLVLSLIVAPQVLSLLGFPSHFKIIKGIDQSLEISFPFDVYISCDEPGQLIVNGQAIDGDSLKVNLSEPLNFQSKSLGQVDVNFKLFGLIPIRRMEVKVVPEVKVYPGGHSIGVLLHADGVMVVENAYVEGEDGRRHYPARDAGIGPGDYLVEINGKKVLDKEDVGQAIYQSSKKGQPVQVKVRKADGSIDETSIQPVKNKQGTYMIGLFIEDGVAGVGTLSFYEPVSGRYGGLGHVIAEANTRRPIQIRSGEIVNANISGINSGQRGLPGEKLGTFLGGEDAMGKIDKNCDYGIYGKLNKIPRNPFFKEPIPVATSQQVEEGRASIYTVVNGNKIEKYTIEIERVYHQNRPATRGLIIKIVDPKLLQKTGGIIQGMSGSPIVQNGRLVGAVTHVFVNDPKKGYGVLAEWMIQKAGIGRKKYKKAN